MHDRPWLYPKAVPELEAPDPRATHDMTPASGSPVAECFETGFELVEECSETGFELVEARSARLQPGRPRTRRGGAASFPALARLPYDRSFRRAVAQGYLTIHQAIERGSRLHYAGRLALRHGLSPRRALLVTDNRISLLCALLLQREERKRAALLRAARLQRQAWKRASAQAPSSKRSGAWPSIVIAAAVAIFLFAWLWNQAEDARWEQLTREVAAAPKPPPPAVPSIEIGTSIRRDPQGRPTEVVASAPRAVLEAYCRAIRGRTSIVRLVPTDEGWSGIHRQDDQLRAILIRKDSATGRWRTGNGKVPVPWTVLN